MSPEVTQVTFVHAPSVSHMQHEPSFDLRRRTQMDGPSDVPLCLVSRCQGKIDRYGRDPLWQEIGNQCP